jgi:hypothetical protein
VRRLVRGVVRRLTGYDVVRIALGVLLLSAAGLKAHQLATEPVAGAGLLDSRRLLMATVEFELFFGLWLLTNIWPKPTWVAALTCFGLFACVSLCKALAGHPSCGCFGRVPANPWGTMLFDLAIVVSLLIWRPRRDRLLGIHFNQPFVSAIIVFAVWPTVGLSAAVAMRAFHPAVLAENGIIVGENDAVILEPEKWAGKRFPLIPFIENTPGTLQAGQRPLRERLAEGSWAVLLYHHDCPKCRETIPQYEKLALESAADSTAPRVALVEVPPYGDAKSLTLPAHVPYALGRLNDEKEWFVETPATIGLISGWVGK